jgi:hypothetical protein
VWGTAWCGWCSVWVRSGEAADRDRRDEWCSWEGQWSQASGHSIGLGFWCLDLKHKIDGERCRDSWSGTLRITRIEVFDGFCIRLFDYGVDASASTALVDVHRFFVAISIGGFDIGRLVRPAIVRELEGWSVPARIAPLTSLAKTITVSATKVPVTVVGCHFLANRNWFDHSESNIAALTKEFAVVVAVVLSLFGKKKRNGGGKG